VYEAAFWGLVGSSSLLLGALIGYLAPVHHHLLGLVMGFGAGALISALTFELTAEAFRLGGADTVAAGLAAGALTYFGGNRLINRRAKAGPAAQDDADGGDSPLALLLGAVLDGIPESAVIGITVLEGGEVGVAFLAAVFISNLPEALASAADMKRIQSLGHVMATWTLVVAASTVAAAAGYGLLDGASGDLIGFIQAFAGGAVLTMLADEMMPQAFRKGGDQVGLITTLGFALAYLLSQVK
jgi:ZIP family zinc transporter